MDSRMSNCCYLVKSKVVILQDFNIEATMVIGV